MHELVETILEENRSVLKTISKQDVDRITSQVIQGRKVVVAGKGRTGLVAGMFSQRLCHLGVEAAWNRDLNTPRLGNEDLLIVCSGTGETPTLLSLAERLKECGVLTSGLLGRSESSLGSLCDSVIELSADDAGDPVCSEQPSRSLFEQSLLLFVDGVIMNLINELDVSTEEVVRRHTNIE